MSSIFSRSTNIESVQPIIKREQLMEIIPPNTYDRPNSEMIAHMIEWRWRFFNIDGHDFVEMSQKYHDNDRLYVDGNGNLCKKTIGDEWDQYIIDEKYFYAES